MVFSGGGSGREYWISWLPANEDNQPDTLIGISGSGLLSCGLDEPWPNGLKTSWD